jgi:hypothetical protein
LSAGSHTLTATVTDAGGLQGSAQIALTVNGPPTVGISSPPDGTTVNAGDAVTLTGTASDIEDGDLSASIVWTSDLDGAIDTGASVGTSALSAGNHTLTATVTDGGGLQGSAQIGLTVNAGPVVTITAPADGSQVTFGDSVGLGGTATDLEDGDLSASLAWSSSLDGALGSGGSVNTSSLSVGAHTLSATVTDSAGFAANAQISLTVDPPNAPPIVTITSPAAGSPFNAGDNIGFVATAVDPEDTDISAAVVWSSDLDGALGTGASINRDDLTPGAHLISADVMDSGGLPGHAQIVLTVNGGPVVSITAPPDGTTVNVGDSVTLTGTASDTEDGDLSASLAWTSDLDGLIGIGESVINSNLSAGTHQIRAEVTDTGGLVGYEDVTLYVNAPPQLAIVEPVHLSQYDAQVETVPLVATAVDPEDGDVGASVVWTSSLEGPIGTGDDTSFIPVVAGPHAVTASALDSAGVMTSEQLIVIVPEPGAAASLVAGLALLMTLTRSRRRRG